MHRLFLSAILCAACLCFMAGCASVGKSAAAQPGPWRAVHVFAPWHDEVPMMKRAIAESLAPMGVDTIVMEVNYKFEWQSHPELREPGSSLTRDDVRELVALCRAKGIRLVPMFNCIGHQSWQRTNFPLVATYPELDESADVPLDNEGIKYCRSWCPSNPKTNEIVFDLMDELVEAFEPDTFHIGADEVFEIARDGCPRCKGKDPAAVFAQAINDIHGHLAGRHGLTVMMWGDRLIDCTEFDYGWGWECSQNGTAPAIDMIPKDIVVCDWHYEPRTEYASLRHFQDKGFRAMPATWHNPDATRAFIDYAKATRTERLHGYMFTTWVGTQDIVPALLGENAGRELPREATAAAATLRLGMQMIEGE